MQLIINRRIRHAAATARLPRAAWLIVHAAQRLAARDRRRRRELAATFAAFRSAVNHALN